MSVKQSDYQTLLSEYSNREGAIALLRQHRPYLEMLPSLRRPQESLIPIPLPVARIRTSQQSPRDDFYREVFQKATLLPCDLVILMCDPEWKIKLGGEILVFIHRPHEDFADFLGRWRQTQILLDQDYEWLMPPREQHMFSEAAERIYPLFVVFAETPERVKRGLLGAGLPFVPPTLKQFQPQEEKSPHDGERLKGCGD